MADIAGDASQFAPVTEAHAEMYRFARQVIDPQELAKRKKMPGVA